MLKGWRGYEIVLGAVVASAAWAVLLILTSYPNGVATSLHEIGQHLDLVSAFITAIATAFIARYTLTLKRSTDKLWDAGEKQFALARETSDRQNVEVQHQIDIAKEAGRAAQKSADAAVAAERARFYVVIKKHNLADFLSLAGMYPNSPTMPYSFEPVIEYAFKNYGKTPGIISEVSHGLIVHEAPPDPVYQVSDHLFVENMIAAGETTETQKFDGPVLFDTIADALPILTGQKHFWFCGRFDYTDVFGNPQVHRFFMRYVKTGLQWGFQPYDHKHYNQSS
ncbi:hypothetical protein [Bradyrhizobium diazoefficiens]